MTNEEAKKMLKAKLECLKRETSGTDIDCNYRNCDECDLCYAQGNMGEQKEALDMAIKAVERVHTMSEKEFEAYLKDEDLVVVKRKIFKKALEQQPCDDCISREETLKAFAEKCNGECACCKYNGSGYDTAENCKLIKSMPSVTPHYNLEQYSDKLWKNAYERGKADVLDKIRAEIKALTDGAETERIWNVDVLAIIDKYKESEE